MKYALLLFGLLSALPASAKWGECESTVMNLTAHAGAQPMSYFELADAVTKFSRLRDKVAAVRMVLPVIADPQNVDGAIQVLTHLREKETVYRAEEGSIVFEITRYMPGISSRDLSRLINATKYLKNKISVLDMMQGKILNFEADGAASILSSVGKGQTAFVEEEKHVASVINSRLQSLTAVQLVKLVETARYTVSRVNLFNGLVGKVSNINDFDSVLRIFRDINLDSQTEVDMLWKLRTLEPRMDAERLLALSRAVHTSRAQAKVFEYFEPMTKQKM
jgi:hypothetical protein